VSHNRRAAPLKRRNRLTPEGACPAEIESAPPGFL
jgi:hypothetical protein